ncbi:MAG: ferritin family protein [Peptostreptococcaceae bacterium]|nr:ferritin family protein [Peptostreptococcaceae bacterium]
MKIQDYAIEKEEAAKKYYENFSGCSKNPGIKKIFNMLAEEEQKHCDILKNIDKYDGMEKETGLLENATELLISSLKTNKESLCNSENLEVYEKAIEMEHESIRIYENAFSETDDPKAKKAFRFLADQEIKHKSLIENIIEFITKPKRTVEDAEFARLDPEN